MFEQNESLSQAITRNVRDALTEDLGTGDWTAQLVPANRRAPGGGPGAARRPGRVAGRAPNVPAGGHLRAWRGTHRVGQGQQVQGDVLCAEARRHGDRQQRLHPRHADRHGRYARAHRADPGLQLP